MNCTYRRQRITFSKKVDNITKKCHLPEELAGELNTCIFTLKIYVFWLIFLNKFSFELLFDAQNKNNG